MRRTLSAIIEFCSGAPGKDAQDRQDWRLGAEAIAYCDQGPSAAFRLCAFLRPCFFWQPSDKPWLVCISSRGVSDVKAQWPIGQFPKGITVNKNNGPPHKFQNVKIQILFAAAYSNVSILHRGADTTANIFSLPLQ